MAACGGFSFQEHAELHRGAPGIVEWSPAPRALGVSQHVGSVVPEHVAQPPLGHAGQVVVAAALAEPSAEVIGFDESRVAGVGLAVVDAPQALDDRPCDHSHLGVIVPGKFACSAAFVGEVE